MKDDRQRESDLMAKDVLSKERRISFLESTLKFHRWWADGKETRVIFSRSIFSVPARVLSSNGQLAVRLRSGQNCTTSPPLPEDSSI